MLWEEVGDLRMKIKSIVWRFLWSLVVSVPEISVWETSAWNWGELCPFSKIETFSEDSAIAQYWHSQSQISHSFSIRNSQPEITARNPNRTWDMSFDSNFLSCHRIGGVIIES
jgi:hypothetical protein